MSKSLFRKASLDSISSPDQLNDYIKVSNPSVWLVLAALFILIAAVSVWGFIGSLPTTIQTQGVASGGNVWCYVEIEDAEKIDVGQTVFVTESGGNELAGQVSGVEELPMSTVEIASELKSDYLVETLSGGDFAVKVIVALDNADLADLTLLDVSIVTESVRPIDFLLK